MSENSSKSSPGLGNTKQVPPSKNWCFTLNNYDENDLMILKSSNSSKILVFQEEIGESGTPHLQGYIEFITKKRPFNVFAFSKAAHWEKRRGSKQEAIAYCSKADTRKEGTVPFAKGVKLARPIKIITKLKPWQQEVEDIVISEPDDRTINWFWEEVGNVGKSVLCKYLCHKHGAIICSGKAADIKYMVVKYKEKHGVYPDTIVYDIPRTSQNYVSYQGIEEIKNGCFMSSKYECDMVVMNSPHIICFANFRPNIDVMSKDRWNVKYVGIGEEPSGLLLTDQGID
ncbi:MAG: putative viral replication protein [Cressdnaviricota sp.]|nr:MAG: putative viral replication protein [Cressdnaviricota sp.]